MRQGVRPFVLIVVALVAHVALTQAAPPNVATAATLIEFYRATNGARSWKNRSGWSDGEDASLASTADTSPRLAFCGWFGVTCDDASSIVSIRLSANGLQGALPTSFSSLGDTLTELDLSENALTGNVELFKSFTRVRRFILGAKQLTTVCVFPWRGVGMEDCLGYPDLGSVQSAYVARDRNIFSGDVSSVIHRMLALEAITLNSVNVSGSVDERLCRLTHLQFVLWTQMPLLSGSLPACLFTDLLQLKVLIISESGLTGTIPTTFTESTSLLQFVFAQNGLTGQIPAFSPNLLLFAAPFNHLSGSLPSAQSYSTSNSEMANKLETVIVDQNQLEGTLPPDWGSMRNLKAVSVAFNRLTGSLPDTWANLTALTVLRLGHNIFSLRVLLPVLACLAACAQGMGRRCKFRLAIFQPAQTSPCCRLQANPAAANSCTFTTTSLTCFDVPWTTRRAKGRHLAIPEMHPCSNARKVTSAVFVARAPLATIQSRRGVSLVPTPRWRSSRSPLSTSVFWPS